MLYHDILQPSWLPYQDSVKTEPRARWMPNPALLESGIFFLLSFLGFVGYRPTTDKRTTTHRCGQCQCDINQSPMSHSTGSLARVAETTKRQPWRSLRASVPAGLALSSELAWHGSLVLVARWCVRGTRHLGVVGSLALVTTGSGCLANGWADTAG